MCILRGRSTAASPNSAAGNSRTPASLQRAPIRGAYQGARTRRLRRTRDAPIISGTNLQKRGGMAPNSAVAASTTTRLLNRSQQITAAKAQTPAKDRASRTETRRWSAGRIRIKWVKFGVSILDKCGSVRRPASFLLGRRHLTQGTVHCETVPRHK
jgi:hypothetical protein